MKNLSVVLITYNEEAKVESALKSVEKVADQIVVVDSFSTDSTVAICRHYTDKVFQKKWSGYVAQKQYATDLALYDWVLSLDADEVLSAELVAEVVEWKSSGGDRSKGYFIPRMTKFMGRWIKHTTWYPDLQLRLFHRDYGVWKGGRVHESFQMDSPPGRFANHIHHFTYSSCSEYLRQLENFSSLAASDYYERGKKAGMLHLAAYPATVFIKNYVIRAGFLDGLPGFVVSVMAAVSTFFKYLKLFELQRQVGKR